MLHLLSNLHVNTFCRIYQNALQPLIGSLITHSTIYNSHDAARTHTTQRGVLRSTYNSTGCSQIHIQLNGVFSDPHTTQRGVLRSTYNSTGCSQILTVSTEGFHVDSSTTEIANVALASHHGTMLRIVEALSGCRVFYDWINATVSLV